MTTADELKDILRPILPPTLQGQAGALAQLLSDVANGAQSPETAQNQLGEPALAETLHALAGQKLSSNQTLLHFGAGNEIGQVSIGDIAGGHMIKITAPLVSQQFTTQVKGDVVIGRKIVDIRLFGLPWPVMLAIMLVLLGLVGVAAYRIRGPAQFETNDFGIAVADFARQNSDGSTQADKQASQLSRQVFQQLEQEQSAFSNSFSLALKLWHDSLPWTQKRATIGYIDGSGEMVRRTNAEKKAQELNADVLIYGYLLPDGSHVAFSFYVSPNTNIAGLPYMLLGHYQLGKPVSITDDNALQTRVSAAFWLIGAIRAESQGRPDMSLNVLEQAEHRLIDWGTTDQGKEILYILRGQAHLARALVAGTSEHVQQALDQADLALSTAQELNETTRAYVGQGSVALYRVQCALGNPPCIAVNDPAQIDALLDQGIRNYETALRISANSPDQQWVENVVMYGLGAAYYIKGEQARLVERFGDADHWFTQAIQQVDPVRLQTLAAINEYRELATVYQILGSAYLGRADLAVQQDAVEASSQFYAQARAAFQQCLDVAKQRPQDEILANSIARTCAERLANIPP
jgi:tetratricopeptide (TPR) repeat protein